MALDPVKDGDTPEANAKHPKKGALGKNKWYLVGGLGLVAILVFYFVSKSKANSSTASTTGSTTGGLDPTTAAALQTALGSASQANNAVTQGDPGSAGPAGPAGPAGAAGAPGAAGKTGATGPAGKSPTPTPKPGTGTPKPKTPAKPAPKTEYYTVKPGDSLSKIAAQFHLPNWQALYSLNRSTVGSNPNLIHPGMRLKI